MIATTHPENSTEQDAPRSLWAGLALTGAIALAAFGLRYLPGFNLLSPLILAILIGMAIHNLIGTPAAAKPGVTFSLKKILRAGIILLGLQLTFAQVAAVGWVGVGVIMATLVATFLFTKWLGRQLGLDAKLTELIAAACVTVFGSLSMVLIPVAETFLQLGPHAYGLWTGASIHEVAQVVAAAFQQGEEAGHFGTIAKLTRVMMLAPMVLILGYFAAKHANGKQAGGAPIPWFVLGFVGMVGVASTGWVPQVVEPWTTGVTQFLLAMALAAMGLETDIRKLAAEGVRPALLGAASWIFIVLLSLLLVLLTQGV